MLSRRWEPVAAVSTVAVVGLATGLAIPLVSLRLAAAGASGTVIGAAAALPALGILFAAPLTGPLTRRWPVRTVLLGALALSALSLLLLTTTAELSAWLVLRFTVGAAAGILLALGETWINEVAADGVRGRWVAVYTSVFTLCQVSGPGLLAWLGSSGSGPILVTVAAHLPGALLLTLTRCEVGVGHQERSFGLLGFARAAPVIVLAVLMFSFFDSVVLALFPLYGMAYGHPEQIAVLLVGAVFAGDALLQVPLGWLADRVDRGMLHLTCGVVVLVLALGLPVLMPHPVLLWPALVLLGGAAGGVYTLGLVRIGEGFRGADLVTANACATTVWGLGSLAGPPLGGLAVELLRPDGLMLALAAVTGLFLLSGRISVPRHGVSPR
ncbi:MULTISPECIES: MFS transporter [unclassified Crossiella]|uniref:MFS transporter n=1 Tax=unclassified Crossiella TaxID=2620835 RepID=UPI001FFFEDB7|nr:MULTISPECIES: MFS transporter [unclassified Crossiella]MCK2240364.1 MFS transporter [Crossiella sp. S99.2]MCK2253184.1 MFS transporter [Crossiella sp. S99.1]